jgi:hypothetical protein
MEAMDRALKWLTAVGGSCLLAAGAALAAPPASSAISTATATVTEPPIAAGMAANEKEFKPLLDRLTELSERINKDAQSPDLWRHHLDQAQVMMKLAGLTAGKERNEWVKHAIDSCFSAAVCSPEKENTAHGWLKVMPRQITRAFPGCPAYSYAAREEIEADYVRITEKPTENPNKNKEYKRDRLMHFAREYPQGSEAPEAVQEAAQLCESMEKPEEARKCYRYLAEHFPNHTLGRKAVGTMWRMGAAGETVSLNLPLLFATGDPSATYYDLRQSRGHVVVVYFWSSTTSQAEEDFLILKQITDRYQYRGLDVVYVNLDTNLEQAKSFLAGRLTSGTHVHQDDGLNSPLAERYGIQNLPQTFLIGRDGSLVRHSIPVSKLEAELASQMPHH